MGIYSNYITENSLINISDNISVIESVLESGCELDNFNKIIESINILAENNIILEKVDFAKIKEKLINVLKTIGGYFKSFLDG